MRRRQPTPRTENGIFIIESKNVLAREHKDGPRQSYCSYIALTLFGLFIVQGYIFFSVLSSQASTTPALKLIGDAGTIGDSTASDKQYSSSNRPGAAAEEKSFGSAKSRSSTPPTIPRRLIFTYKYNLIAPSPTDQPFDFKDPLTANVLHTIEKYQSYWDANDARARSQSKQNLKEEVVVSFLSDKACIEVIAKAEPRLVEIFQSEEMGEYKADICRVAELYLHGGYYFDIDIGVIEPLNFDDFHLPTSTPDPIYHLKGIKSETLKIPRTDDIVTFSSVYNGQGRFFQAFTAAMPRHPVLKRSLDYIVAYYDETLEQVLPPFLIDEFKVQYKNGVIPSRKKSRGMGVGPFTLSLAHRSTTDGEWENYVSHLMKARGYFNEHTRKPNDISAKTRYARFLYEVSLEDEGIKKLGLFFAVDLQDAEYKKKISWCNFVCFEGRKVYFYSRVQGSKGCPLEKHPSPLLA